MSDALTDIARDQRRAEKYYLYMNCLVPFLEENIDKDIPESQIPEITKEILAKAQDCDTVPRGYWQGSTDLAKSMHERIGALLKKDKTRWAKLLVSEFPDDGPNPTYTRLKRISPFADCILIYVDYGFGFVSTKCDGIKPCISQHEIDDFIDKLGWRTYDADDYLVAISTEEESPEIIWLRCGCFDPAGLYQKGPEKIKGRHF